MLFLFNISFAQIGVVTPSGEPKILSAVYNQETSEIEIKVKNLADEGGAFYATISDCPMAGQKYSSQNIYFEAGETGTIYFPVSVSGKGTCEVKVTDYNWGTSDSFPVILEEKTTETIKPKICTPGERRMAGSCIYECNQEGDEEIQTCCDNGVIYDDIKMWKCRDKANESNNGFLTILLLVVGMFVIWKIIGLINRKSSEKR